jgi:hypothetical protein
VSGAAPFIISFFIGGLVDELYARNISILGYRRSLTMGDSAFQVDDRIVAERELEAMDGINRKRHSRLNAHAAKADLQHGDRHVECHDMAVQLTKNRNPWISTPVARHVSHSRNPQ